MAKTAFLITLDYQRAIRNANSLDTIAADILKYRGNLNDNAAKCNRDWKGDNAIVFTNKERRVSDNLEQIAANIRNTAETIRRVAKRTYDAEMRTLEIARNRSYR